MSKNWRLVFVLGATSGCVTTQELAARRASGEFRCPAARIVTVPRPDISDDVVDVRACGQVARYSCFHEKYNDHCIRESIFEQRDVDALMSLPEPSRTQP